MGNKELEKMLYNYRLNKNLLSNVDEEELIKEISHVINRGPRHIQNSLSVSSTRCSCCGKPK